MGGAIDSLRPDRVVVISDSTVWSLHSNEMLNALHKYAPITLLMGRGEMAKSFATLERLCERAIDAGVTRRSLIVAFGGGVVGNTAGLMAALLFRGIRLLHVPTTLLAASDSVVSLKSAINSHSTKNAFGAYVAPQAIIVLPHLLRTLPRREVSSGLAELVKASLITGEDRADRLMSNLEAPEPWPCETWRKLVQLGVEAKLRVLSDDPHEGKEALIFEYGHTVGHALELADAHRRNTDGLSHGAAVAVGMHAAALIAEQMGIARPGLRQRHLELLNRAGLPTSVSPGLTCEKILPILLKDNKRGRLQVSPDEVPMILLEAEGRPARHNGQPLLPVPIRLIEHVVSSLLTPGPLSSADDVTRVSVS